MKTYSAGVVAAVTGASLPALQRYKQHVEFQPCDITSAGSGEKCGYSIRRVVQIALVTELSHINIGPKRAAKAAFEFSDKGSKDRAVGELFPLGTTYLVGLPGGVNKVLNVPPDLSIADVLTNDTAAFIVNVNNVIAKITKELEKAN